jgi:DNA polymerase III epsilon subunit-like protein
MNLLTLDFETFYDKAFSLTKITTEEYIRSPLFETIGVAVKVDDGATEWCSGDFKAVKKFLQKFDIPNNAVCAQNAHFDCSILNWVYGIKPFRIIDTLSMANVLHGINQSVSLKNLAVIYNIGEKGLAVNDAIGKRRADFTVHDLAKYGEYCINDVELTYTLARFMMPQFSKKELKLIDMTVRMYTEPALKLDKKLLEKALYDLGLSRRNLMLNLMRELGVKDEEALKKQLMSNDKFAELLKENGVEPPRKKSPTTGKDTWAFAKTDEEFTMLEDHPNPTVQTLFAARMGFKSTIGITRAEAFLSIAERGTFPFPLKYSGASVTHRWSGFDVNPQNLSRIDPDNPKPSDSLRYAIHAPKGYKLVVADLSNIELRLGLWLAGQHDKLQLIRDGVDLYRDFAAEAYGIPYDSISKKDSKRFVGKCACIAEGELVLTKTGMVPIAEITLDDMVWDGVEWVSHTGVIYMGEQGVISYEGLTATNDHNIWTEDGRYICLGEAASRLDRLAITGNGREAIRYVADTRQYNNSQGETQICRANIKKLNIQGVDNRTNDTSILSNVKQTKRVYDITNAGPRHRFTVSGKLVSNCLSLIYGTGAEKLQNTIRIQSKGANTVTLAEATALTKLYRTGYNKVVLTWGEGAKLLDALIRKQTSTFCNGGVIKIGPAFTGASALLFDGIGLVKPNGMVLAYPDLKKTRNLENGKSEYTYAQRRSRDKVYGAKVFQRVTQSLARDIMAEIIIGIGRKYHVVGTVHDECILLVPDAQAETALEELLTLMRTPPEWAPDLPLDGEGGIAESYGDAKQ